MSNRINVAMATVMDAAAMASAHRSGTDHPWNADAFAGLLAQLSAIGVIARCDAAVAGFVLCRCAADECEVLSFVAWELLAVCLKKHSTKRPSADAGAYTWKSPKTMTPPVRSTPNADSVLSASDRHTIRG
jgi:hypothetical protein